MDDLDPASRALYDALKADTMDEFEKRFADYQTTATKAFKLKHDSPRDELSPEARRIHEYLVGNSSSTPSTASPPAPSSPNSSASTSSAPPCVPSSAASTGGISEPAAATSTPASAQDISRAHSTSARPGVENFRPRGASPTRSAATSLRTATSARVPAAAQLDSTSTIVSAATAMHEMADLRSVPPTTCSTLCLGGDTSATATPASPTTGFTMLPSPTEIEDVHDAVDLGVADLAVSAPATCLAECPSRNGSVLVAELISPATSISSTTTCDVLPELAASAVSEEAPSVDDDSITSKNGILLPLELIESELPGSKESFVRPLLPQFAQVEASRAAPLSTVSWSQFQPDHVQFSGEHQYSQLIPGATLSLLPWDPGDSKIQDIMGEFLELKSWPFWLFYLEYYGDVNMSWQQVCAPVLSEHFRWKIAWSCELLESVSASSLQAVLLYWSATYHLQFDCELLQWLIAWSLATGNGYAVAMMSYLSSQVWVILSSNGYVGCTTPYGAGQFEWQIAWLLNLRTMQLTFWSYCVLSQFTIAPDYYPLRSIHSLGLLLQIVLPSSDYCHLVFCSMGTCSFLQSSECPWFLASGDEMEMRPVLTLACSAACYNSACFAWEIAWLLVGTSYACSDFERTENDTGKSRPPNFIWQDWLSCLMGHIIQCGCDLLQGKIAWSLNCEFACLTSEDFLLLHEGEIWQASFIVSSYWLGGGAVGYMFCAAFLFSRDRNSTIDSVLAIKHNSGMFNHTLQILEFGNYGAMEIILWSSHLSQVWVLYLPTTSRRQCGSQLMLWELASSEDDILTYTKQVFISWDPGGPAPVLDAAAGINRRSIPWPFSHLTWDPGGYMQHRLEGKPNLKEGGLSGTCPTLNRGPSALGMTPPASIGKKGTNTWDKATEKDGLDGTEGLGLEGEERLACRLFCVFFFL